MIELCYNIETINLQECPTSLYRDDNVRRASMKKVCTKCLDEKPIEMFPKHYKNIGYHQSWCRGCINDGIKKWKRENKEKVAATDEAYRKTPKRQKYVKAYKQTDKSKEQGKEYRARTKDQWNLYLRTREANDPKFKLARRMRTRMYMSLKERRFRKLSNTADLVGCSFNEMESHLEKQFKVGMSWNNYGQWHVDHIKPLHSFDLSTLEGQKEAFNYKNLQPLWAKENMSKGGKC